MIDSGIFILKIAARLAHLLAATKFLCSYRSPAWN